MTDEMIRTPSGQMPAYVAVPPAAGPWPGVVVIHDFAGMSQDLRNQADWLAGEGYLAAAPDLYYWGSRLRCLRTIMREIAAGSGRTFDDIGYEHVHQAPPGTHIGPALACGHRALGPHPDHGVPAGPTHLPGLPGQRPLVA
jgi:carboxymethylenebutenolidase